MRLSPTEQAEGEGGGLKLMRYWFDSCLRMMDKDQRPISLIKTAPEGAVFIWVW